MWQLQIVRSIVWKKSRFDTWNISYCVAWASVSGFGKVAAACGRENCEARFSMMLRGRNSCGKVKTIGQTSGKQLQWFCASGM